jgi:hypothetical protein
MSEVVYLRESAAFVGSVGDVLTDALIRECVLITIEKFGLEAFAMSCTTFSEYNDQLDKIAA